MAQETCPACGGSGIFGSYSDNIKCQRCYGSGRITVPDKPSGSGSSGCFVGSTPVLTPEGWRPISEIKGGEQIVTFDERSKTTVIRHVKKWMAHKPSLIWEVNLSSGESPIRTTKIHSFLTDRGWKRTEQLEVGDVLMRIGKEAATVSSVVKTKHSEPVFNLITEEEHTFIVQGCVVHNFTYFRRLRMFWHKHLLNDKSKKSLDYAQAFN